MNSQIIEINNVALTVKYINGNPVVTFSEIDKVHDKSPNSAAKAFRRHKTKFIEGVDYFLVNRNSSMGISWPLENIPPKGITYVTESGYLMIAKVFDDKLAWEVQRKLVNSYFSLKELSITNQHSSLNDLISMFLATVAPLATTMNAIATQLTTNTQMLSSFMEQNTKPKHYKSPTYPAWLNKVKPQINIIREHYYPEDSSYTRTYGKLYKEFNDTYGADYLSQLVDDFCFNSGYESAYTMDVISHDADARAMMETIIDNIITEINTSTN